MVAQLRLMAKEELSFLFMTRPGLLRGDGLGLGGGNALGAVKFGLDVGNVSFREIFK